MVNLSLLALIKFVFTYRTAVLQPVRENAHYIFVIVNQIMLCMRSAEQKHQYIQKHAKILIEAVAFHFFQITQVIGFATKGALVSLLIHCLLLCEKRF